MQFSQIDFNPLTPIDKFTVGLAGLSFGKFLRQPKILGLLAGFIISYLAPQSLKFICLSTTFAAGFVLLVLYGNKQTKVIKTAWKNFAAANNWPIQPADISKVPPGLLGVGHSQNQSEVINAKFDGLDCDLFTFEYTIGSGRSSQTRPFAVVRIQLAKNFPHIILNNNKMLRGLDKLQGYEQLPLEGNFNQYFNFYIPKGEEIDALSIITPDVMQTVIDNNQLQDIEISGANLYFIGAGAQAVTLRSGDMKALLQSVNGLSKEIILRSQSLDYSPAIQPAVAPPLPA